MSDIRREFKSVFIKGKCFLYPLPIIKDKKYLIEVPREESEKYIEGLRSGVIKTPEEENHQWNQSEIHTDGATLIYSPSS